MIAAMKLKNPNESVINIGSGRETSIQQVCDLACRITGRTPEIVFNQKRVGGPDRMCADLTLARELLGYEPKVSLEMGMQMDFEGDSQLR